MNPLLVSVLAGVAVVALVTAAGAFIARTPGEEAARRLRQLASGPQQAKADPNNGILLRPSALDLGRSREWLPNPEAFLRLYEQADVGMDFKQFLIIPPALAITAAALGFAFKLAWPIVIVAAALLGFLPFFWLTLRKKKRIKQFVSQMPDALELVGRALRAGHGLASGLHVVAEEMPTPISTEFGRVFEEQNLGIPIEDALRGLAERVPTMDVRFFATSVIIQRTTGGDLAEILDKISRLIRERFQILGQVQALTAEGRLSGIVLLALPPGLLIVTYLLNPEYTNMLFSTTAGVKLLAGAAFMQVLGAIAIKKIITIKV
jgi:tight adherence protein B